MLQKKTVKKYGFFMGLIVIANLVGFNPALAFSDQDFAHLLGRVRALEDKVFDAQQKARIAICEKVHSGEQAVKTAHDLKTNASIHWNLYHIEECPMLSGVKYGKRQQACDDAKYKRKAAELKPYDQHVETAENALKSAQAEAKSAGAVCN